MGEPIDTTLRDFRALGEHLRTVDRFHEHRRSRLSGPFDLTGARAAPRVLVSDEAVAFRPNRGVYVVVRDRATPPGGGGAAGADTAVADADEDRRLAQRLLDGEGVAGVWTFAAPSGPERHGWRPGDRAVTVCYLDEEPLAVAGALGASVLATADERSSIVFAGPLETITPWCWDWFDEAR